MNKYILITGASSGIGKICAKFLCKNGFKVFAGVRRQEDADYLTGLNCGITPVFIDVTDDKSIETAYIKIKKLLGNSKLFGLVNNAGIAVAGPIEFLPIEKLRLQMEINVIGQVKIIQKFLPLIRESKGRIVNISSIAGFTAFPFKGAYCASKHAFEAISDSLRRELKIWNIPVSIIEPGIVKTPIWERSLNMVEKTIKEMPEAAEKYYGSTCKSLIDKTMKKVDKKATSPENVAVSVYKALSDKTPKTRYLVGNDAKFLSLLTSLPDTIIDWIICKKAGITCCK